MGELALSQEQRTVVEAPCEDWLLVEAGPGTGKTAVACARVAHLLRVGVSPGAILMLSFTRTAVAELRQRIRSLSKGNNGAAGVRITTLDSEAWHLGVDLGGTPLEKAFKGFDANIADATELFLRAPPELLEWLDGFRHVMVDEAQDLVGLRAKLVLELFDKLPKHCGITVFADPAQAIYGFSNDAEDEAIAKDETAFHERLISEFEVRQLKLTKLYRTNSPALGSIFEEGRTEVFSSKNANERLTRLRALVQEHAEPSTPVTERVPGEGELILFRRRAEVLLASSLLAERKVPHRLRLSHTQLGVQPWVACLFERVRPGLISKRTFDDLWAREASHGLFKGLIRDELWALLMRVAGTVDRRALDVRVLRRVLSRPRPPPELAQNEVGHLGPTLGTIHASKGRESDEVRLMLPVTSTRGEPEMLAEEVRVAYVGATRARKKLSVADGYHAREYKSLDQGGRIYRHLGERKVQVELGRMSDFDELSTISRNVTGLKDGGERLQRFLKNSYNQVIPLEAKQLEDQDFTYRVRVADGGTDLELGDLTQEVNRDLFRIAKGLSRSGDLKPPSTIIHLVLSGVRAFVVPEDCPRIGGLAEPWVSTGFFLAPVVRGVAYVQLVFKSRGFR